MHLSFHAKSKHVEPIFRKIEFSLNENFPKPAVLHKLLPRLHDWGSEQEI